MIRHSAKDNAIRISGKKDIAYPQSVSVQRRGALTGTFDRTLTVPMQIDTSGIRAEYVTASLLSFCRARRATSRAHSDQLNQAPREWSSVMSPQELQVQHSARSRKSRKQPRRRAPSCRNGYL
jgi:hypothetical protein